MVKATGGEVEVEEYATADEVDGIRRTLDSFMKKQEKHNDKMSSTLDKLLVTIDKLAVEDKGSSFKGKKPQETSHFYSHPHSTHAHFDAPEEVDWSHHDNVFVEYELDDCPWNAEELEKFYEFANSPKGPPPPKKTQQQGPQGQVQFHHQVHPHIPDAIIMPPANQFTTQMHYQYRTVANGPKLSFPEFNGTGPDGCIRKAEKFFELVGVPTEERVKIAVLYIHGMQKTGGEEVGVMQILYHGISFVECWVIDFMKPLHTTSLHNFIT